MEKTAVDHWQGSMEARAALEAVLPDFDDADTLDYMAEVLAETDADDLEDNLLE